MLTLISKLTHRRELGNLRTLRLSDPLIDFASNDYLGLARSKSFALAVTEEWEGLRSRTTLTGFGSTGSRLLTGNTAYAEELEERIARFHGFETGLLFNCGYMANLGLLSAITDRSDLILFDASVHASTHDGMHLSQARALPFRHNDLNHLENRLKNSTCVGRRFICVESVYSMDGTKAPLEQLCSLAERYGAQLIVDEAHAIGIFGAAGRGLIAELGLTERVFAIIATFGKALGANGAIVLGNAILRESLINFARSFVYTTASPLYALAVVKCAYEALPALDGVRLHLQKIISLLNRSKTPIQPVIVRGNRAVQCVAQSLAAAGFDVRPLMSPTVRRGQERLRVCLHAHNSEAEVNALIQQLNLSST